MFNWFKKKKVDKYADLKKEIMMYWEVDDKLSIKYNYWSGYPGRSPTMLYLGWDGKGVVKVQAMSFSSEIFIPITAIASNQSRNIREDTSKYEEDTVNQAQFDEAFRRAYKEVSEVSGVINET